MFFFFFCYSESTYLTEISSAVYPSKTSFHEVADTLRKDTKLSDQFDLPESSDGKVNLLAVFVIETFQEIWERNAQIYFFQKGWIGLIGLAFRFFVGLYLEWSYLKRNLQPRLMKLCSPFRKKNRAFLAHFMCIFYKILFFYKDTVYKDIRLGFCQKLRTS